MWPTYEEGHLAGRGDKHLLQARESRELGRVGPEEGRARHRAGGVTIITVHAPPDGVFFPREPLMRLGEEDRCPNVLRIYKRIHRDRAAHGERAAGLFGELL